MNNNPRSRILRRKSLIPEISDAEMLNLLHPNVYSYLEKLDDSFSVFNGTKHIYGFGRSGAVSIDRDPMKISMKVFKDRKEIVKFEIRDRGFDGTPLYKSPLTEWFYHADEDRINFNAAELSTYSRDPNKFIEGELSDFFKEPFDFIFGDGDEFVEKWKEGFVSGYFPGQQALPIKKAAEHFVRNAESILLNMNYEPTASPSHFNVVKSFRRWGYSILSNPQSMEYNEMNRNMEDFDLDEDIKEQQKSWIVLLQKFPGLKQSELKDYWLKGLEFPLFYDGSHVENVWMGHTATLRHSFPKYEPKECRRRLNEYYKNRYK